MALRLSTALRNYLNQDGSLKQAFKGGVLEIYSGSQPANADAAVTGTLLATITDASGAHTNETRATGSVQITAGAAGSIDSITVKMAGATGNALELLSAAVPYNTSINQTASDVADNINAHFNYLGIEASASTDTITLTAPRTAGTDFNGMVVTSTATTLTTSDSNFSSGVDSANGLDFGEAASGILSKLSSQTWSGVAGATGTAGWFRLKGAVADAGSLDSSYQYMRMDGSISTSGAQMNLTSTSISSAATQTISDFDLTLPAS